MICGQRVNRLSEGTDIRCLILTPNVDLRTEAEKKLNETCIMIITFGLHDLFKHNFNTLRFKVLRQTGVTQIMLGSGLTPIHSYN